MFVLRTGANAFGTSQTCENDERSLASIHGICGYGPSGPAPKFAGANLPGLLGNISEIESVEGESEMENMPTLKGVQYLVDSSGKRTAVVISLEEWGKIWKDFYDVLVSGSRKDEPTVAWETLKEEYSWTK